MKSVMRFLGILLLVVLPVWAHAQETVPQSRDAIQFSFAPIIKKVAPAVVNIYTRKVVSQRLVHPFMQDPFFREFFGDDFPKGMSRERMENSLGSGVIIREDGLIITNSHVIQGADQIVVALSDRREYEADLITNDKRTDIAVLHLRTKGERFPTLTLRDSDAVEAGDLVLAIGNPFGVGQTVTMGIVSAAARSADVGNSDVNYFIQTDAAINPGNSGGALVAADGGLIGIPSAIYSRDGGSLGIGFAIPANLVRAVLASVKKDGKVERGWLGLSGQSLTSELAEALGLERPSGVIIKNLHAASPAKKAGLKSGDVILSVNGHVIEDEKALRFRIASAVIGDVLKCEIRRGKKTFNANIQLVAPPENPARDETTLSGRHPLMGMRIANLSPALSQEIGFNTDMTGVVVLGFDNGSPAARLGLMRGDILVEINNQPIESVGDCDQALRSGIGAWRITVQRGGQLVTLAVRR